MDVSHLSKDQREQFRAMLSPFSSMWSGKLGSVNIGQHRIETPLDSSPFRSQPYRAVFKDREAQASEVKRQPKLGVIEPSQSEWASPVLRVPKPDGSKRFCVYFRRLNLISTKDSYPLPYMDECLDSLGEAKYFSTFDTNCGYWQLSLKEEERAKTKFVFHEGCDQYTRMIFGLCNAPATFQRTMDIVLSG